MKGFTWRDLVLVGFCLVYMVSVGIACYISEQGKRKEDLQRVNTDLYGEVCYMQGFMDALADKKPDYQAIKQYMKERK